MTRAPAGSRAAALTLARQLLSRLVVPAGSQAADPSPVPSPLNLSSAAGDAVTVSGQQQPRLWDRDVLATAMRQLLVR